MGEPEKRIFLITDEVNVGILKGAKKIRSAIKISSFYFSQH